VLLAGGADGDLDAVVEGGEARGTMYRAPTVGGGSSEALAIRPGPFPTRPEPTAPSGPGSSISTLRMTGVRRGMGRGDGKVGGADREDVSSVEAGPLVTRRC